MTQNFHPSALIFWNSWPEVVKFASVVDLNLTKLFSLEPFEFESFKKLFNGYICLSNLRKLPIFSEGIAGHITVETLLLTFTVAAESFKTSAWLVPLALTFDHVFQKILLDNMKDFFVPGFSSY